MNANNNARRGKMIRLPDDLWEELNHWAEKEERSVNSQIVWALKRQLVAAGRLKNLQKVRNDQGI